jgi:hypothetical protein
MAAPDDRETKSRSSSGCIVVGILTVIALLVIGFFAVDAVIGKQVGLLPISWSRHNGN